MAFLTRKIDSSKFDGGSSTDVYEISDGDRLIGKKRFGTQLPGRWSKSPINLVTKPLTTQTLS
jgi:hypothetical protein